MCISTISFYCFKQFFYETVLLTFSIDKKNKNDLKVAKRDFKSEFVNKKMCI